ncbi:MULTISPECIES: hypothetical protein [Algoriphagus]|jgi:hypothetical protein|uniref:Competence protein CoiA-like family protein n=1 Tax=Algoriphagus winogradskyi TaxID=237017 RepID=A0ABY1NSN8_9BACT|nr:MULTISPECIES: hypothetical protein [Algoriphagus]QYH39992.1 hypothetical protein GYM62_14795 [Algoriphagus sp. NBT04N3]SMP16997.1 hypothetical protein SAMN06265367_102698 [Algoriphagus winogradskyi]|tara:strand:+ start:1606 stop:3204 length:1599 start_codon:yes stop_codon:yes gene_type:complete
MNNWLKENENVFAFNVKGDIVFAPDAESGRNGYFCMGCNRVMQAVKSKKGTFFPYFRHDASASKGLPKCTYKDETFRHKLAKDILQIEKQIKVPDILKHPPIGINSPPNLIEASHVISAEIAKTELTFYEDENCEIRWGKNENVKEKNLLIKPDISFFDKEGKPTLLIEIVATHKIDEEKFLKLQRLGIDTVQVVIPKASIEDIRNFNKHIKYIKWVYNHVEQKSEYIQLPPSNGTGILSTDEIPDYFFKESFKCRAAQIRDLIRRIGVCLESEQYRTVKQHLESEIQRVESSTERIKSEQEEYRSFSRADWESRNSVELERIKTEEAKFKREERDFRKKSEDLVTRYYTKRGKIDDEQRKVDEESRNLFGAEEQSRLSIEGRRSENNRTTERVSKDIDGERNLIKNYTKRREELPNEFEQNKARELCDFKSISKQFKNEEESIDERRNGIIKSTREFEEQIGREFETRRRDLIKRMDSEEFERSELLSSSNNPTIQGWKSLHDLETSTAQLKRARAAFDSFKEKHFKNWED